MFKRNDESEWARFSKAFPQGKDEKKDTGEAEATAVVSTERAPQTANSEDRAAAAPLPAAPAGPAPQRIFESSLAMTRPAPSLATSQVFSEEVESTIGPTTFVDGKFRSENGVRIHGTAQGEIESAKSVFVEENAKVSAKVTAACIIVAGEVNGELNCTGRVEIRPSGRVTGTINAATLIMQEGAFFDGNLKMKGSPTAPETNNSH